MPMGVRFVSYPALSTDSPWKLGFGGMWLPSRSSAARRRPGVTAVVVAAAGQHGPGSVRRPPTAHAGNAPCARYSSAPAATTGWSRRQMPQRPIRRGSSARHGSLGGKSPRGIGSARVPASPWLGVLRRRSAAEARPVAARARHCPLSEIVVPQSMITGRGCR